MPVTIQQIRSRIGDPPSAGAPSVFSDDDVSLAITEAADYLLNEMHVPIEGIQGEAAVRLQACIQMKNDLVARLLASNMTEGKNSIQIRDAQTAVSLWQEKLDEYINTHRRPPRMVV